ncbi:MAG: hypothetical protein IJ894_05430 [Bacteroidales bacterium]|nr:hypothetical protein [Bacteroidales bacterium]
MREIAKQQQESAGFKPDIEFTEIVSEDVEDGEPSGEKHTSEQFVKKGLKDGVDANDPNSEAVG